MADSIIIGISVSLAGLFIGWFIRQQNRRDREYIKGIVKEEMQDTLQPTNIMLQNIQEDMHELKKSSLFMNEKALEKLFKEFK
jgi:hypothetical protein